MWHSNGQQRNHRELVKVQHITTMQIEVDQCATIVHQTCHQFPSIITIIDNMADRGSKGIMTMTGDLNTIVGRNWIKRGVPTLCQTQIQFNISSLKCFRKFFSKTSTSPFNTQLHTRVWWQWYGSNYTMIQSGWIGSWKNRYWPIRSRY